MVSENYRPKDIQLPSIRNFVRLSLCDGIESYCPLADRGSRPLPGVSSRRIGWITDQGVRPWDVAKYILPSPRAQLDLSARGSPDVGHRSAHKILVRDSPAGHPDDPPECRFSRYSEVMGPSPDGLTGRPYFSRKFTLSDFAHLKKSF